MTEVYGTTQGFEGFIPRVRLRPKPEQTPSTADSSFINVTARGRFFSDGLTERPYVQSACKSGRNVGVGLYSEEMITQRAIRRTVKTGQVEAVSRKLSFEPS